MALCGPRWDWYLSKPVQRLPGTRPPVSSRTRGAVWFAAISAIATITLLPKSIIPALRDAATPKKGFFGKPKDKYPAVLAQHGREVERYVWSGYVLATLLPSLKNARKIDLMKSEFADLSSLLTEARGATVLVLDAGHKHWLSELDPAKFSEQELRDRFNQFNAANEPDAGRWMLDGVRFLQQALSQVQADEIGLLVIG